jgi:hypothetical protein
MDLTGRLRECELTTQVDGNYASRSCDNHDLSHVGSPGEVIRRHEVVTRVGQVCCLTKQDSLASRGSSAILSCTGFEIKHSGFPWEIRVHFSHHKLRLRPSVIGLAGERSLSAHRATPQPQTAQTRAAVKVWTQLFKPGATPARIPARHLLLPVAALCASGLLMTDISS